MKSDSRLAIPAKVSVLLFSLISCSSFQLSSHGMEELILKSQEVWNNYCDSKSVDESFATKVNTCLYTSYDMVTCFSSQLQLTKIVN